MRIAVVGAGIFGSTVAIKLAQAGHEVELFEKGKDILSAASGINLNRLHRGYHYPRSKETALSSKHSERSFRLEYGEAVQDHNDHYYAIAKEKSLISGEAFLNFCLECGLEHEKVDFGHLHSHMVEFVVKCRESIIDPVKLRGIVKRKINDEGIKLFLEQTFSANQTEDYDLIVNAAYANSNSILEKFPDAKRQYQFELCEIPVLKLPESLKNKSLVMLDGPFFCIDPYSDTGYHGLYNVVHSIHATNVGFYPEIPKEFVSLINRGIVENPPITNIAKFIEAAAEFMVEIREAQHIGSMYTVRTVLPNVHGTDERPTLVTRLNDRVINVFSGKLGNCVEAAYEVLRLIEENKALLSSPLVLEELGLN